MSLLTKIRGLYRWDGDEAPLVVSRRRFIFLGTVAAAGALLPIPAMVSPGPAEFGTLYGGARGGGMTSTLFERERWGHVRKLRSLIDAHSGQQWLAALPTRDDMAAEAGKRGWV